MNEVFQKFREANAPRVKAQLIQHLGQACETVMSNGLDTVYLRYPKILDLILELHLLVIYESDPTKDPSNTPKPVDIPPAQE